MLVHKTTVGYVTQVFDEETQRFIRQDFIAGDDTLVAYETSEGEPIMDETRTGITEADLPLEMKQPRELNAEQKLIEVRQILEADNDKTDQEKIDLLYDSINTNC
jgi:hypothetical protein